MLSSDNFAFKARILFQQGSRNARKANNFDGQAEADSTPMMDKYNEYCTDYAFIRRPHFAFAIHFAYRSIAYSMQMKPVLDKIVNYNPHNRAMCHWMVHTILANRNLRPLLFQYQTTKLTPTISPEPDHRCHRRVDLLTNGASHHESLPHDLRLQEHFLRPVFSHRKVSCTQYLHGA